MKIRYILILLLLSVVLLVAVQNSTPLNLRLVVWKTDTSLPVLMGLSVGVGILLVLILSVPAAFSRRRQLLVLKKELRLKDEQLSKLEAQRIPELRTPEGIEFEQ